MDLRKLKTLIDLVSDSNVSELEITEAEGKVRIVKGSPMQAMQYAMPAPLAPVPAAVALEPLAAAAPVETGHTVKSPMVGTFYASPAPDQPAYVSVGKAVKDGDVLCIIEAMKLMNEIKSETAGAVVEILVQNGQTVEYDQPIMKIKKV